MTDLYSYQRIPSGLLTVALAIAALFLGLKTNLRMEAAEGKYQSETPPLQLSQTARFVFIGTESQMEFNFGLIPIIGLELPVNAASLIQFSVAENFIGKSSQGGEFELRLEVTARQPEKFYVTEFSKLEERFFVSPDRFKESLLPLVWKQRAKDVWIAPYARTSDGTDSIVVAMAESLEELKKKVKITPATSWNWQMKRVKLFPLQ